MIKPPLKTYFGFGFGPIQIGLFLYEAYLSGNFGRFVISEVDDELVSAVHKANGFINFNIAHKDFWEHKCFGPVEVINPNISSDRKQIISAISEASEIGTAVPSVNVYDTGSPNSIVDLLAEGIVEKIRQNRPQSLIYTAENNNQAAEILQKITCDRITEISSLNGCGNYIQFVNTVIGKMCHKISLETKMNQKDLVPIVNGFPYAILVESYNLILISKISLSSKFERGIRVFQELDDLHPYEVLKLYAHNAIHAVMGFIGKCMKIEYLQTLRKYPEVFSFIESVFLDEIRLAICRKFSGTGDQFALDEFRLFAIDLLDRMTNPLLLDRIDRLTRDVERKLGWNDRLIGSIRFCLQQGILPEKLSFGTAAALFDACDGKSYEMKAKLYEIHLDWMVATSQISEIKNVYKCVNKAIDQFIKWEEKQFPHNFFGYIL